MQHAASRGGTGDVVGASLFAGTAIVLYFVSTLYHAMAAGPAKIWLNRLDHASIYLFIAGSYMPFLLGVLRGAWGWSLFALVWSAAALGAVAKLLVLCDSKLPYAHFIWHLFVLGGRDCHFFAARWYATA